jgi:hypothetical protein
MTDIKIFKFSFPIDPPGPGEVPGNLQRCFGLL